MEEAKRKETKKQQPYINTLEVRLWRVYADNWFEIHRSSGSSSFSSGGGIPVAEFPPPKRSSRFFFVMILPSQ